MTEHDDRPGKRDLPGQRDRPGKQDHRLLERRWWIAAIVAVLVVAAAIGFVPNFVDRCGGGSSIWRSDSPHQECIGVSDGSEFFNDPEGKNAADRATIERINSVQEKIADENTAVAGADRYVKVVLLMPLTVSAERPSAIPLSQILHSLEGVYTAQRRINGSTVFGDPNAVRLQLMLANQGSRQDISDRFVQRVLDVSETDHPLVGVIGLGSSVENTDALVRRLGAGENGIPMVSAITSSDSLTGQTNFWSVSPSNVHYAQALRNLLDRPGRNSLKSGLIVRDINRDPYTRTLADAFQAHLRPYIEFPELTYRGGTTDQPATSGVFAPVVTNLCNAANAPRTPLDMVFYSGRVADFGGFARALENRICRNRPLAVLVGATGFADAQRHEEILRNGNVTVIYASSSDPELWGRNGTGTPPDYAAFADAFVRSGFDKAELGDGLAIAHHDAFATVAMATRLAAQGEDIPEPEDVASQFSQLVLAFHVPAAAGRFSFPGAARGRAVSRGIPLRQIGRSTPFLLPENRRPFEVAAPR
jgi:hypothetical protein